MDDLQWPRALNKVITHRWSQLKNTLVMKDFVDYLIQNRVVTLDYWMGLKSKPIPESERTEEFLSLVMKFDKQKYNYFMEALLSINRHDIVKELVKAQTVKPKKPKDIENETRHPITKKVSIEKSKKLQDDEGIGKKLTGQTDADQCPTGWASNSDGVNSERHEPKPEIIEGKKPTTNKQAAITHNLHKGIGNVENPNTTGNINISTLFVNLELHTGSRLKVVSFMI